MTDGPGDLWRTDAAGVDEVGRGPLAGPVVAAAVLLDPGRPIPGLRDSKRLSASARRVLADLIRRDAAAVGLGVADVAEIDQLNILQATLLAMARAVAALPVVPDYLYVDGNRLPAVQIPAESVVRGDDRVPSISAASIVAKVHRDSAMTQLAEQYPGYGFERHMGYPTAQHRRALVERGPCAIHRRSFAPVRALLEGRT